MVHISEIFYSVQGEGVLTGIPMVFVRFQGCNLLPNCCRYCDTAYAQDGSKGTTMTVEDVREEVRNLLPHYQGWVCITGGEPLFQLQACHNLVRKLRNYGYRTTVETNGSIEKPFWWTLVDSWVADVKCPSSGVCGVSKVDDWFSVRSGDQVKFVVGTQEDLDFARRIIDGKAAYNPVVLVSPVMPVQDDLNIQYLLDRGSGVTGQWLQEVAGFCKELRVRYSLQTQKIIWGNKKGV